MMKAALAFASLFFLFCLTSVLAQDPVAIPSMENVTDIAPEFSPGIGIDFGSTAKVIASLVAMLLGLMLFGGLFKNGTLAITGVLLVSIIFTLIGWIPMWVSFVLCLVLIVLVVWNKA